jgi:hypothetical protein
MDSKSLNVVAAYSNHRRYNVRLKLFKEWLEHTLDSGVTVTVAQHTLGEREHEITESSVPNIKHINLVNLRGGPEYEIWLQHALYNVAISRLNEDSKYVCWQDTDIKHLNKNWAMDTLHMLQTHRVGQTWTHSIDLGPEGNIVSNDWGNDVDRSFCAAYKNGDIDPGNGPYAPKMSKALLPKKDKMDYRSHTGYSWAARLETIRGIGKLLDWMIAGSGDYHMAHGFSGTLRQIVESSISRNDSRYTPPYYRKLIEFSVLCDNMVKQDIGCVDGTITHGWHGSKRLRFYGSREDILGESQFNPDVDITYDFNGLPVLCSDNRLLRDGLRRYGARRNEDSIDV